MQHGVIIENGPADWQIFQHKNKSAKLFLSGSWKVPCAAAELGVKNADVLVRITREDDGFPVIPWTSAKSFPFEDKLSGKWKIELDAPAGGLYKIETCLDTASVQENLSWKFRGDVRFHIGIGNLFLIAGQSNAAGYAADSAEDRPDLRVHLFRNRLSWELACHPMNETTDAEDSVNSDIRINGASPYLSFGRRFADYSGFPVGLIQSAMSGQPISRWNSSESDSLLKNMLERVNLCGNKLAGVLWYQGCSDCFESETANAYGKSFERLVNETRKKLACDLPFFTFQLNRFREPANDKLWGILREHQRKSASTIPNVYILPTIDSIPSDTVHNGACGCVALGERLARQCAYALLGAPKYAPPEIFSAKPQSPFRLALEFSNSTSLIINSLSQADWGFTVEDSFGEIPVTKAISEENKLVLLLERELGENGVVSFAWQADPTRVPPLDCVTYLPPLSFYKFPINNNEVII